MEIKVIQWLEEHGIVLDTSWSENSFEISTTDNGLYKIWINSSHLHPRHWLGSLNLNMDAEWLECSTYVKGSGKPFVDHAISRCRTVKYRMLNPEVVEVIDNHGVYWYYRFVPEISTVIYTLEYGEDLI